MEWDAGSVVIHNWPKLEHREDGRWMRTWEIILEKCTDDTVSVSELEKELSTHENQVFIKIEGGKKVMMKVITERWGWEDDLYFYSYLLLKRIDEVLGKIYTIQGQERNLWYPWLSKGMMKKSDIEYFLTHRMGYVFQTRVK